MAGSRSLLEAETDCIAVGGVHRYATHHANMPQLHAPKESVMPLLHSTEKHLLRDLQQVDIYQIELKKLRDG